MLLRCSVYLQGNYLYAITLYAKFGAAVLNLGQVRSVYIALVHSAVQLVCGTNTLCALIAAWLDAFQKSRDYVRLNRATRERSVKCV